MTVVGCVWGAHRGLVDVLGADAPSYEWCEREWSTRLRRTAPAPAAVPGWLYQELFFAWRRPAERPAIERQMSIFEVSR